MGTEEVADPESVFERLDAEGLSDGLPVIPPTDSRVEAMLATVDRDPDAVLLQVPTSFADLTLESLASCAVMAGCKPAYFPVVLAAIDALAEWPNFGAVLATTSGFSPLLVVNGPIRREIEVNCSTGLFGPTVRANATIGRTISLVCITVGELLPESGTMATHAHPGRFTYCIGELEEASQWDPLHVTNADLSPETNAVTVMNAHAPYLLTEHRGPEPTDEDILEAMVSLTLDTAVGPTRSPGPLMYVLGQDHAAKLGEQHDKRAVQEHLHDGCVLDDGTPMFRDPADAHLVVAGGIGNYSSLIHSMTAAGNEVETVAVSP